MAWYSLTLDLPAPDSEVVEALLHGAGASGLEVRDGAPPHLPKVRQPKAGEVIVVAYFDGKAAAKAALAKLHQRHAGLAAALEPVEERDWSNDWKTLIRPVHVGRLWVGPSWEQRKAPKEAVQLVIEPKMAFGTGDHPTTSLCLRAVDDFLQTHAGASVLDVGTGTGVLALAAKKLGARRVVATDNDPIAVGLAKENAEANRVTGIELSTRTLKSVRGTFDLVLANILANTLVELAPLLAPKVKQRLVLAGVLAPQAAEVTAAYLARGLRSLPGAREGEWVRLDFEAR